MYNRFQRLIIRATSKTKCDLGYSASHIDNGVDEVGESPIVNSRYNLQKYMKKEKMFLSDYNLESVLIAYGIKERVSNCALADANLINSLAMKVNKFHESLYKNQKNRRDF